jgi:hypothetical protein
VRSGVGTATASTPVRRKAELGTARRADQTSGHRPGVGSSACLPRLPLEDYRYLHATLPNRCLGRTAEAPEAYTRP